MNKKKNMKSIILTIFLIFSLIVISYAIIGIFISGPTQKYENEQDKINFKIAQKNKDITSIEKHSFNYVTYVAETKKKYYIYDKDAKQIATRNKNDAQFEAVQNKVNESYPALKDTPIKIGYGYKSVVYVIEKDYTLLLLNFDDLKEVFYMKEGE